MFKNLELQTEHLILRNFIHEDAEEFHKIINQPGILDYLPDEPMELDEVKEIIDWFIWCYDNNSINKIHKFVLAIIDKKSGRLIGNCGLGPIDFMENEIEIFYILSKEYWNKGLMKEAALCLLNYGFKTLEIKRISGLVKEENIASKKILEYIGMKYNKRIKNVPKEFYFYENELYYTIEKTF